MKKRRSRQLEDEEPKAVREMKKNKNRQIEKENKKQKKKLTKKEKKKIRKKIILTIIAVIILIIVIMLGVSAHTWLTLAKDMVSNESSIVVDTDGNTIAKLRR